MRVWQRLTLPTRARPHATSDAAARSRHSPPQPAAVSRSQSAPAASQRRCSEGLKAPQWPVDTL
jgi:hypothetical protein